MRRSTLVGLGLALPLLAAADMAAETLWAKAAFEDACFQFVNAGSGLPIPQVPPTLKALAAVRRRAAVEALGARAKAYYASAEFKKRWASSHGGTYADPAVAAQISQAEAQGRAAADKAMADAEKMLPMMPPEMQAKMRAELARAKADQARRQARSKEGRASGGQVPDARTALRQGLERFLRASEGVDYDASLVHRQGRATFVNRAYEEKPEAWKACFRAGREATEAARAYAQAWLKELR